MITIIVSFQIECSWNLFDRDVLWQPLDSDRGNIFNYDTI